jgi:hypothetical protein
MKFFIRDDDTNFFTKPEDLDLVFNDIWDLKIPVSLAVVPFQEETKCRSLPINKRDGSGVYPIGDNIDLVLYLKEKIESGDVNILMHGYSHKDQIGGFEYETGMDLHNKTKKGKKYLEQIFNTQINTFVPPHNSMSRNGSSAVIEQGMNILASFSHRPNERPMSYRNIIEFTHMVKLYLLHGNNIRNPKVFNMGSHLEFGCHHFLESTNIEEIFHAMDFSQNYCLDSGYFGLATHYWELSPVDMRAKLMKIIEYANYKEWDFCKADDIW